MHIQIIRLSHPNQIKNLSYSSPAYANYDQNYILTSTANSADNLFATATSAMRVTSPRWEAGLA